LTARPAPAGRKYRACDFDYELPPDLIAQHPAPERDGSRMLVVRRGEPGRADPPPGTAVLEDRWFRDLPDRIPPGDVLVLNTTRVRHARLLGTRPSGAPAEVLLIHPAGEGNWVALGQPGSALRPGKRIGLGDGVFVETIQVLPGGERLIRFAGTTPEAAIRRFGRLPLPPYIARDSTPEDERRYQTVYAEREGSVAAPTAGLHFTPALLDALAARGVMIARLDLEVGPGTFRPIEGEELETHPMHPERYHIPPETARLIAEAREAGSGIWAVGTTVVRALESAGRDEGVVVPGAATTDLLIRPGFPFRVVDHLITNFHLPRTTLLLLVAAFAGYETTMAAYRHAVAQRYRFYSYGDAMVIM
jgi:S-adenosylmethionine:tRNA ribosyltransferase-isomerase